MAKLRWAKLFGGGMKHFLDALRVYEVQRERLDLDNLRRWAAMLEVEEELFRLMAEAES